MVSTWTVPSAATQACSAVALPGKSAEKLTSSSVKRSVRELTSLNGGGGADILWTEPPRLSSVCYVYVCSLHVR